MYNAKVAFRQLLPLIKWVANFYSKPQYYNMTREELEAEGYYMLVKCCRAFPKPYAKGDRELATEFCRYFKASLYEWMRKLDRYNRWGKRRGFVADLEEVDLREAEQIPILFKSSDERSIDALVERLSARIEKLWPYLSPESAKLLKVLMSPQKGEATKEAYIEQCRRRWVRLPRGARRPRTGEAFRVRERHVRRAAGLSPAEMALAVSEIRRVDRVLQKQGDVK